MDSSNETYCRTVFPIGGPGVGKNSLCAYLRKMIPDKSLAFLEMSEVCRRSVSGGGKSYPMGTLWPDGHVMRLFGDAFHQEVKNSTALVSNGFPRKASQVQYLAGLMRGLNMPPPVVIYANLPFEQLIERYLNRSPRPEEVVPVEVTFPFSTDPNVSTSHPFPTDAGWIIDGQMLDIVEQVQKDARRLIVTNRILEHMRELWATLNAFKDLFGVAPIELDASVTEKDMQAAFVKILAEQGITALSVAHPCRSGMMRLSLPAESPEYGHHVRVDRRGSLSTASRGVDRSQEPLSILAGSNR